MSLPCYTSPAFPQGLVNDYEFLQLHSVTSVFFVFGSVRAFGAGQHQRADVLQSRKPIPLAAGTEWTPVENATVG